MPKIKRQPLTLPQYERIFRTIHGILLNEECDPSKSCMYFALMGAFIVQQHHRLNANPRAGAAAYNFGLPGNSVLAFGRSEDGKLISDDNAFHFWIEVDDWVIDFAAPLFQAANVQPKMFQKTKSSLAPNPNELDEPGSFVHATNPGLTNSLLQHFQSLPMNADLVNIGTNWYRPPPKTMTPFIQVSDSHGKMSQVRLSPVTLVGAW